jgi:hypothetical protein
MTFDLARLFGFFRTRRLDDGPAPVEHVMVQRPLARVLAFTGRSIDDVVNCPVAKREVLGYYKLYRWVERQSEVSELERQWNGPA